MMPDDPKPGEPHNPDPTNRSTANPTRRISVPESTNELTGDSTSEFSFDRTKIEDSRSSGQASMLPDRGGDLESGNVGGHAGFPTPDDQDDAVDEVDDLSPFQSGLLASQTGSVGRYTIQSMLGSGGFGVVLLGIDSDLQRRVAIKIPHRQRFKNAEDVARFLMEARTVARLDHPGVVPIYDFGEFEDRCYVVSKYIEGGTVSSRMKQGELSRQQSIKILATVATVLDFIHREGIVHRDIKPANLLLDESGACFVTDFGLALDDGNLYRKPGRVGTYAYMSPEQARGESHLVDGRSDLFSLGVTMYEMLCGTRPFVGQNWQQTLELICNEDPQPLRQIDPSIPKELERICLKLLSKRTAARYANARELADDLEYVLRHEPELSSNSSHRSGEALLRSSESADQLVGIVPRGLRSFDEEDADYFVKLLPGPCDRDGLPDSLRFWKRRIESVDPMRAFRIGVIYGSSGSGKSSFVKAGLLPKIGESVVKILLEASGDHTERQLLGILRTKFPSLSESLGLAESLAWLRQHPQGRVGGKTLIVIDQFEQWLHASDGRSNAELIVALRQCDGITLQCLLLVRDDYWVGVSRFAEQLDVDLVRSRNLAMIDLFDKRHARTVLAEYGRGYARLPDNLGQLNADQNEFLDRAVDGLASDERIIPVQLVTFAEILKRRPWSVKSLAGMGGVEGVGIRFLDEAFGETAPAENRSHSDAVQRVLKSLLPEGGTNIKGSMRSEQQLRMISGYGDQPRRFDLMIAMLDKELRLITPTDSGEPIAESDFDSPRYYQLTHDFLVPAIRSWLQRNQRSTIRGRATLRLADRSDVWSARPNSAHLPSWLEWISFLVMTPSARWDEGERRMMRAATRKHVMGSVIGSLLVLVAIYLGLDYRGRTRSTALAQQLSTATTSEAPAIMDRLDQLVRWTGDPLSELAATSTIDTDGGLYTRLALLRRDPSDDDLFDQLAARMIDADVRQIPLLRDELVAHPRFDAYRELLWDRLLTPELDSATRLNLAIVLAAGPNQIKSPRGVPQSDRSARIEQAVLDPRWQRCGESVVDALIKRTLEQPNEYPIIVSQIGAVRQTLYEPLLQIFRRPEDSPERQKTLNLLQDLWRDDPVVLARTFLDADGVQSVSFLSVLDKLPFDQIEPILSAALLKDWESEQGPLTALAIANRQINAAAMLCRAGRSSSVWGLLRHHPDPTTRTGLIERAIRFDMDPQILIDHWGQESDGGVRSAILLMLGSIDRQRLSDQQHEQCLRLARTAFVTETDADQHSAAEWMLMQLDEGSDTQSWLTTTIRSIADNPTVPNGRKWSIDSNGQTFVRIQGEGHVLEIATHEVTKRQFAAFQPEHGIPIDKAPQDDCPACLTDWYEAVDYCRWLTEQQGMTERDQCHPPDLRSAGDVFLYDDYLQRRGYRLLTPIEWESACFGQATTLLAMGDDPTIIPAYGWTLMSDSPLHSVRTKKPLRSGLFGMYGNVTEWCTYQKSRGTQRPIRGIGCNAMLDRVLQLSRGGEFPATTSFYSVGFRVCRSIPE